MKRTKNFLKRKLPNNFYKSIYGKYSCYSTAETNESKNQQEELGMIELNPVNKLMTTSEITQWAPSLQPFTNLWGKQR